MATERLRERVASVFLFEPVLFGALARLSDAGGGSKEDEQAALQAQSFIAHPWFLHDEERGGRDEWLEMFVDYWNRPGAWSRMPEPMQEQSRLLGWKMFQEVRACFFDETSFGRPAGMSAEWNLSSGLWTTKPRRVSDQRGVPSGTLLGSAPGASALLRSICTTTLICESEKSTDSN